MKPTSKQESKWRDDYWLYKPFKHITRLKKRIKRQASKARRREWNKEKEML